jgi:O-antigen ligase
MNAWSSQWRSVVPSRRGLGMASGFELALVPLLGAVLLVRVLTDDLAAPNSRQSGSLDLSGVIAVLLIILAGALLVRRRRGVLPAALAVLWLCTWTAIALNTSGVSTETLREGVREASVVALGLIVYNLPTVVRVRTAARLVQLVGFPAALVAVYQLAAHTGMDIGGNLRANGTFAHPDSAAMYFAIATVASLWAYLENGQHRLDAVLTIAFAAALVATLSIDGLVTLVAMLVLYGVLRPGPLPMKLPAFALAGAVLLAFFATPLGATRIASESSTSLSAAERGEASTSLDWRLHKWETLLTQWEASPLVGQGLGTTTTTVAVPGNRFSGKPPHNEYVRYLVETGVLGLALLLGALAVLIGALLRRRALPGEADAGTLNAATFALVIVLGCLVDSLADNTLLNSPTCYAAALIVVAALSLPVAAVGRVSTARAA